MQTADALREIVTAMTPLIGENMARAAASAQCGRLGIGDGVITAEQMATLVAKLETGLHVFIGRDRAAAVMNDLLGSLRGRP